jgi:hypothetical protein
VGLCFLTMMGKEQEQEQQRGQRVRLGDVGRRQETVAGVMVRYRRKGVSRSWYPTKSQRHFFLLPPPPPSHRLRACDAAERWAWGAGRDGGPWRGRSLGKRGEVLEGLGHLAKRTHTTRP